MTSPGPDVDRLREQLRALGYLDARVDRFVLSGVAKTAQPVRLAAAASARIGIIAGALLGPAAAVGLRARAPELVTGPADAAVAAIYLALLFGLATALVAGLAVMAGTLAARRGAASPHFATRAARAAGGAGIGVGIACLIYLTLWWRAAATAAGDAAALWTTMALAVGVGISLLLGHAVTLTVLAVLARMGLGGTFGRGLPLSSRRALVLMATIAGAGAIGLLLLTGPRAPAAAPPSLTVVPTGERVLVLAIDGIHAPMLQGLARRGRLPTMAGILDGATAPLAPVDDTDPARVWTTIATGQPPDRHGIRSLQNREVAGLAGRLGPGSPAASVVVAVTDLLRLTRPAITSGTERRVPALWEIAGRAGLRTAVIHWWATWPPARDLGTVITDRALLRLERGGDVNGEIEPASLYTTLLSTWPERRARAAAAALRMPIDGLPADLSDVMRRSATLDATLVHLAADSSLDTMDLVALYLPGLDIVQHAVLSGVAAPAPGSEAPDTGAALERYYEFLDGLLTPLAAPNQAGSRTLVLVTQPGRVTMPSAGLMAIAGGPAANAAGGSEVPVTAVLPTVLHLLGVPVAEDLASAPALAVFSETFQGRYPVRHVTTFGPRQSPVRPAGEPLDQQMIERMRSLGYVGRQ